MPNSLKLEGKRFGRLVVLKRADNTKKGMTYWLCKCDCGNTKIVRGTHLQAGKIKSCGCLVRETSRETLSTHRLSKTRLYRVYCGIKARCYNPKNECYRIYGGRGITMCEEWKNNFLSFYNWAINNGHREDLSIDRINNDGNYEPNNCRWATPKEQSNNTRRCIYVTYNNETHTITEWGRILNIDADTLLTRYHRNKNNLDRVFYNGNLRYCPKKEQK